jgi:hypothetical protein
VTCVVTLPSLPGYRVVWVGVKPLDLLSSLEAVIGDFCIARLPCGPGSGLFLNSALIELTVACSTVLRTRTIDETSGFLKTLIDPKDGKILGFTMIGPEAGEVMAVVQMTMLAGFPYTVLRDAILTHPTMAEGLNALFSNVKLANKDAGSTDAKPPATRDLRSSAA